MEKFLHSDVDKFVCLYLLKLELLLNMNIIFWNSSMSLNEGTTELILENNSLRHSSNLEHFKMKLFHPLVLYYRG
jgi:hypothetical protein